MTLCVCTPVEATFEVTAAGETWTRCELGPVLEGLGRVTLDGQTAVRDYATGTSFDVAGKSGFTIEVKAGLCEYICSYLPA